MSELGPERGLLIGRAAEHLVCADLLLGGISTMLSEQGMPFDLIADVRGRLFRIQVKGTLRARRMRPGAAPDCWAYVWPVKSRGKNNTGARLSELHCDLVALVALDIRMVAYLPVRVASQTVQLRGPGALDGAKRRNGWGWTRTVDQFPFSEAISGDASGYVTRHLAEVCLHGHAFDEENTIRESAQRVCRTCRNERARLYQRRRRARVREHNDA